MEDRTGIKETKTESNVVLDQLDPPESSFSRKLDSCMSIEQVDAKSLKTLGTRF